MVFGPQGNSATGCGGIWLSGLADASLDYVVVNHMPSTSRTRSPRSNISGALTSYTVNAGERIADRGRAVADSIYGCGGRGSWLTRSLNSESIGLPHAWSRARASASSAL